jgi:hypothetical protein
MPLVIEDGTGVAGANSYASIAELRIFATDRGVAFPAVADPDPAIAIFTPYLIRACDYLESLRDRYNGWALVPDTQELAFPRAGIFVNAQPGFLYPGWGSAAAKELPPIPNQLKNAQCQLVLEQMKGISLSPSQGGLGTGDVPDGANGAVATVDGRVIIRDKLDVIETQWSDTQGTNIIPIMPTVEGFLQVLLRYGGNGFITGQRI